MICENCGIELQDPDQTFCPNCGIPFKRKREAMWDFKGSMLVSEEGLPIASALPQGVDETRVAAMTAALLSLAERSILEMKKGEFDQLFIKGSDGYLLVLREGSNVVLKIDNDIRLLLIFLDACKTRDKIKKI